MFSFSSEPNAAVTSEIVKSITNENYSVSLVRSKFSAFLIIAVYSNILYIGAARIYFLTLQRHSKNVSSGKLGESQKKQRLIQRKHNVGDH